MQTKTNQQSPHRIIWIYSFIALGVILILGWILRYQVTLTSDLIPGINGAYYPVQVRSILETGLLGLPDFPLLFYAEAAFAGLLSIFLEQDQAIMTAVRWTDTLFPVLIAVPVFLFALSFPRSEKNQFSPVLATLFVGLIAVTNTSLLRMAGDFQKNAAGLPLSLTFFYFLYQSLNHQRKRDIVLAAFFFGITCLTHLGVAALTITIAGLMAMISLITHPNRKRSMMIAIGLLLILGLILGLAYLIDPVRIERLLGIVFNPSELFTQSTLAGLTSSFQNLSVGFTRNNSTLIWGNILGGIGIVITLIHHKSLRPAERSLLWAASLTTLFFASPLISGEWSQRLALMAFVPGLIPITFLIVRRRWGWMIGLALALSVSLSTLNSPELKFQRGLSMEGYNELLSFEQYLPEGDIIIIAPHGTEWWVAWTLETAISNRVELAVEAWDEYDAVYVIESATANPQNSFQNQNPPNPNQSQQAPPGEQKSDINSNPVGVQPPQQNNSPGNFRLTGLSEEDTVLVSSGKFYTLSQIEEKPIILQGGGAPDLRGELSAFSEDQLTIDGQDILFSENTVFSRRGEIISASELATGSQTLVWGESSLFGDTMVADYVMMDPLRPTQENPSGQNIAPGYPSGNPSFQATGETVLLGSLEMVTRRGWGAKPINFEAKNETGFFNPQTNPLGVLRYKEPISEILNTLVIHHSAFTDPKSPLEIQELHQNKRGYADISYHFLIDPEGTLYQGRLIELRGAHTEGFNTGSVGIMLSGNFNNTEPTAAQLVTLKSLIQYLEKEYTITHLAGHHDFNPDITECPGDNMHEILPDLATEFGLIYGTGGYVTPPWVK